jgi:hypothetical protein
MDYTISVASGHHEKGGMLIARIMARCCSREGKKNPGQRTEASVFWSKIKIVNKRKRRISCLSRNCGLPFW